MKTFFVAMNIHLNAKSSQCTQSIIHWRNLALVMGLCLITIHCGTNTSTSSTDSFASDGKSSIADAMIPADKLIKPDLPTTTKGFSFKEDSTAQSPSFVAIKAETVERDTVWLNIVGKGINKIQGIAFRVQFDPQLVQVIKSEAGPSWPIANQDAVAKFAARKEGELLAGLGFLGARELMAKNETILARVQIKLLKQQSISLNFRNRHNLIIDHEAKEVQVDWFGGTFDYQ